MTRNLKKLLLWLLIAVLPIQGFAAAIQRSCSMRSMVVAAVAVTSVQEHSKNEHAAPGHMQHSAGHEACAEASPDSDAKPVHGHGYKHGSCSACASCCVGAAAPPALLSFDFPSIFPEVRHSSGLPVVVGFIPDSLERPPRHLAA